MTTHERHLPPKGPTALLNSIWKVLSSGSERTTVMLQSANGIAVQRPTPTITPCRARTTAGDHVDDHLGRENRTPPNCMYFILAGVRFVVVLFPGLDRRYGFGVDYSVPPRKGIDLSKFFIIFRTPELSYILRDLQSCRLPFCRSSIFGAKKREQIPNRII